MPAIAVPARNSRSTWIIFGVIALSMATVGMIGFTFRDRLNAKAPSQPEPSTPVVVAVQPPPEKKPKPKPAPPAPKAPEQFPRRMLAICVNQYLFANPVSYGSLKSNGGSLLDRMADRYKFPKEQTYLLTDGRSNRPTAPPIKPIIQATVEQFLNTSRPQDQVVLLFAGHAKVIDGKCYLVPLEGELDNPNSLLELDWLFTRLKDCKARQKIFIADVCRFDPTRGAERPSPGPMPEALEAALKNPPDGVQVWSACSAKQYSYEFRYQAFAGNEVEGGLFLNHFFTAFLRHGTPKAMPGDSIPIDGLAKQVADLTTAMAQGVVKESQTPFLAGKESPGGAEYNAAEPPASKVVIPKTSQFAHGGVADAKLIKDIVAEIKMPPVKRVASDELAIDDISGVLPFSAEVMREYAPDYGSVSELIEQRDKYPLRVAVLNAVEVLDRHGRGELRIGQSTKTIGPLRLSFTGPVDDNKKKAIEREQREGPAAILVELEDVLEALEKLQPQRNDEPSKRWRANYDYVLAMVKCRYVYINEFDLMLGKIRKDELPPLDAKVHNGWRLASQEKMACPRDIKDKADEAKKLFAQIIKEHPGTPWEVLARRERLTALGLTWQPASTKADQRK